MPSRTRRAAVVLAIAGLSACVPAVSANAEAGATPTAPNLGTPALDGVPFDPGSCSSSTVGVGKSGSIDITGRKCWRSAPCRRQFSLTTATWPVP